MNLCYSSCRSTPMIFVTYLYKTSGRNDIWIYLKIQRPADNFISSGCVPHNNVIFYVIQLSRIFSVNASGVESLCFLGYARRGACQFESLSVITTRSNILANQCNFITHNILPPWIKPARWQRCLMSMTQHISSHQFACHHCMSCYVDESQIT